MESCGILCFCAFNPLTEAQMFIKFETYVHKIVLDHQPNFHKDPCKDARARGVNARIRDEMHAPV